MNKIKTFFNLDQPYKFDVGDLTALLYTICVIGVMVGADMTLLFCIASTYGLCFCWQARKLNLVVLNAVLWVMNIYNLIQIMIWGVGI